MVWIKLNGTILNNLNTLNRQLILNTFHFNKFAFSSLVSPKVREGTVGILRTKMPTAVIRLPEGESRFNFTFLFENSTLGVNRRFNFYRSIDETARQFVERISVNLEKSLTKKKKKKSKETSEEMQNLVTIKVLRNGEEINLDTPCKDVLFQEGTVLKIMDCIYDFIINPPWINSLALPTSILEGFPVYPSKLELEYATKEFSKYAWFCSSEENCDDENTNKSTSSKQSESKCDWHHVGTGFYFTPRTEHIGHKLKLIVTPGTDKQYGEEKEVVSTVSVEAGPGVCPFQNRHCFTSNTLGGRNFRVVSYNILADLYADSDFSRNSLFPYCPPYALSIDYRKQLILKELIGYNADLMFLQEVDSKVFDYDLEPVLASLGLKGIFDKKGGQVSEGVSCFFRQSRFRLVSSQNIILSEELPTNPLFSDIWQVVHKNEALKERLTKRTTALQIVVLQSIDCPNEHLVIGNTHLYFHPDADHIRMLQAGMIMRCLKQTLEQQASVSPDKTCSLMLCGDFNSTPEFGVYHLMTKCHIPFGYPDWTCKEEEAVLGLELKHDVPLTSACGTPLYTNFTQGFSGCLDYIFYQTDSLEVTQVIPMPSEEELKQYVALPNVVFPSDHVAIVADLKWKGS